MKSTKQKVLALVEQLGAEIEYYKTPAGRFEIIIDAPAGMIWWSDGLHCLVHSQWDAETKSGRQPTEELWRDALDRIKLGLTKCEAVDCDYCAPEDEGVCAVHGPGGCPSPKDCPEAIAYEAHWRALIDAHDMDTIAASECVICEADAPDTSELSSPAGLPSHAPEPSQFGPHGAKGRAVSAAQAKREAAEARELDGGDYTPRSEVAR
jgi:hypothetical protein